MRLAEFYPISKKYDGTMMILNETKFGNSIENKSTKYWRSTIHYLFET